MITHTSINTPKEKKNKKVWRPRYHSLLSFDNLRVKSLVTDGKGKTVSEVPTREDEKGHTLEGQDSYIVRDGTVNG